LHFDEFPEAAALLRWRKHEFLEVERAAARRWRAELAARDPGRIVTVLRPILPRDRKLSNLEGLKAFIDEFCANDDGRVFTLALQVLGLPAPVKRGALERWQAEGRPRLEVFAPYCAHVFKVDLVFYLGIARGFISGARASNLIDMAYLYYLPFATVFISGDKLHRSTAPLFLTDRQAYLWKDDFKAALGELDQHYDQLPNEIERLGVMRFATYPPSGMDNAVTRLWDAQIGRAWREAAKRHEALLREPRPEAADRATVADLTRKLEQARPVPPEQEQAVAPDDADYLFRRRWVPAQKGKWRLVPDEVLRRHDSGQT
jgi:hypothetical protein